MRKTSNILIRQTTKKSGRDSSQGPINSTTSIMPKVDSKQNVVDASKLPRQQKKLSQLKHHSDSTQIQFQRQLQKQITKAQTLSDKEVSLINEEAKKTIYKKVKNSENRFQNQMVFMLQQECARLGSELEKQKLGNQKLRKQIQVMRLNICNLNEKLEKINYEHSNLSKNQIDGKMQNKQMIQQMQKLKSQVTKKQQAIQQLIKQKQDIISQAKVEVTELNSTISKLKSQNEKIKQIKDTFKSQLQHRNNEFNLLKEQFIQNKNEWQSERKQYESQTKLNLQKKGEKITKIQTDGMKLQQKLKQQQNLRKKLIEKNKQLQAKLHGASQSKVQLQQTISSLRKRVNDLSILKSSNNTIMNQKIVQLTQQNQKLKKQVNQLKGTSKVIRNEDEKPVLFGTDDTD